MSKIVKNPTNIEIATELCKKNPTKSYAQFLEYDAQTGTINKDKLAMFGTEPVIANEFISDMTNKVVVQRTYDLFRDWDMPFKVFMREMGRLGDVEELLTAELSTPADYDEDATPFGADKPSIVLSWVKTEDKKVTKVKLSYEIWAGAFVSEQGLSNIAGIILKNLRDSLELLVYDNIRADFSSTTMFSKEQVITAITGAGETANAQTAYEEILKLASKMSLPSTSYNTAGVKTLTGKGRAVLVLNPAYKASFDVNVLASLFNSDKIGENKYFKEVIVAEMANANQIGIILDEEAYLWGYRINVAQNIINPANLTIEEYYHRWVKRAGVPFRNAVRLVTQASA